MDNTIYHGINNYPDTIEGYKQMKLDVLSDFAIPITDTLKSEIEKRTTEIQLDNFCTDIIGRFMDNQKMNNEDYLKLVLAHPDVSTLNADVILKEVGLMGLYELQKRNLITPIGIADGIKIYAL